jgi:uncharacterized membrane protein
MLRTPVSARLLLLTTLVLAGSAVPAAAQIPFTSFDVPGAVSLKVYGINDEGVIVGTWSPYQNEAPPFVSIGFIRSTGGRITTPILNPNDTESFTVLRSINDEGVIAGFYGLSVAHGFVLTGGSFIPRDFPGALDTAVRGNNNRGDLSGTYDTANGPTTGFIRPLVGPPITFGPPSGGSGLYVSKINDWRQVVGFYTAADGTLLSFLRQPNGQLIDVIVPGSVTTLAYGINDCGIIVGLWQDNITAHGFYGRPGNLHSFDLQGAGATFAREINNRGQIVGEFGDANGSHGFVTAPIAAAVCKDD